MPADGARGSARAARSRRRGGAQPPASRAPSVGLALAVASGLLFGLVAAVAKTSELHPVAKGGVAYLVAGVALVPFLRRGRVERADLGRLAAIALVGGALAPALLFTGLLSTAASTASFVLVLEMVFTAALAFLLLGERVRRAGSAGLLLLLGAALAAAGVPTGGTGETRALGLALVAAAALGWAVDNTLSARLVRSYPPQLVLAVKGLVGGPAALAAAVALGWRGEGTASDYGAAVLIGLLGVAASVLLFYFALQRIGATRTVAVFLPTSAVGGAAAGIVVLGERLHPLHGAAALLLLVGVALVTREASAASPPRA